MTETLVFLIPIYTSHCFATSSRHVHFLCLPKENEPKERALFRRCYFKVFPKTLKYRNEKQADTHKFTLQGLFITTRTKR